jgi:hypothetical protein
MGKGLNCTNPKHDHYAGDELDSSTPEGQKLCNDCGYPTHYDEGDHNYHHDDPDVSCFLIP